MGSPSQNPFGSSDPDRREIWDILMRGDVESFLERDWGAMADDFVSSGFFGIDAKKNPDPQQWKLTFPTIESYRAEWLRQAADFGPVELLDEPKLDFLYRAAELLEIEITGDSAMGRKKFNAETCVRGGSPLLMNWQTLYVMRKESGRWKIAGFVGYMPYDCSKHDRK
jgi:hypothetical protein